MRLRLRLRPFAAALVALASVFGCIPAALAGQTIYAQSAVYDDTGTPQGNSANVALVYLHARRSDTGASVSITAPTPVIADTSTGMWSAGYDPSGAGIPAGAALDIVYSASDTVSGWSLTSAGTGASSGVTVTLPAPAISGGVQATATVTETGGVIGSTITITNPGSGYLPGQSGTITFSSGTATATIVMGGSTSGISFTKANQFVTFVVSNIDSGLAGSLTATGATLTTGDATATRVSLSLPNAAPAANGGLTTVGTGSGQLNPDGTGAVPISMTQAYPGSPTSGTTGHALRNADISLPNAAPNASGGLLTFGTGAGQLNLDGSGNVYMAFGQLLPTSAPTSGSTGELFDYLYGWFGPVTITANKQPGNSGATITINLPGNVSTLHTYNTSNPLVRTP